MNCWIAHYGGKSKICKTLHEAKLTVFMDVHLKRKQKWLRVFVVRVGHPVVYIGDLTRGNPRHGGHYEYKWTRKITGIKTKS